MGHRKMMSFGENGKFFAMPSIHKGKSVFRVRGKAFEDAKRHAQQIGTLSGPFKTEAEATAFAKLVHDLPLPNTVALPAKASALKRKRVRSIFNALGM